MLPPFDGLPPRELPPIGKGDPMVSAPPMSFLQGPITSVLPPSFVEPPNMGGPVMGGPELPLSLLAPQLAPPSALLNEIVQPIRDGRMGMPTNLFM